MKLSLYSAYKWFIYVPLFLTITTLCTVLALVVSPFSRKLASRWVGWLWSRASFLITPATVTTHGLEHLDRSQTYVIAANHLSQYDIFVLYGWLGLDLLWVMKKELRKVPLIGIACQAMGYIFLDRSNTVESKKALEEVKTHLTPGLSLTFFPEGTRSLDGKLKPFKKGAFATAKDLDLAILPVTITGTNHILPPATLDLKPGHASLIVHPPITRDTVRELGSRELSNRCRDAIQAGLDQPQHPAAS